MKLGKGVRELSLFLILSDLTNMEGEPHFNWPRPSHRKSDKVKGGAKPRGLSNNRTVYEEQIT